MNGIVLDDQRPPRGVKCIGGVRIRNVTLGMKDVSTKVTPVNL